MAIKEDLKQINALVQNLEMQIESFESMIDTSLDSFYRLKLEIKEEISKLTEDDILNMDEADLKSFLRKYSNSEEDIISVYEESHQVAEEYKDKPFVEYIRSIVMDTWNTVSEINKLKSDKESMMKEANDAYQNYFNYVNSSEYKEKKFKKIEELKSQVETETDPTKKREIEHKLKVVEASTTLSFLTDRLEDRPEKEASNITDTYFNNQRSTLVMNKFASRLPRFGYNPDIYKRFLNFEEMFLPEEYHDLNNIFLFHVMRFISYTDPYNKDDNMYVSSILIKLYNLTYHKFEDQEAENDFIEFIKKVDDYFMPFIEEFKFKNSTSPNHPERKRRDAEFEQKRRMMIITSLENAGVEFDGTMETEELRKLLQNVIDEKEKEAVTDDVDSSEEVLSEMIEDDTVSSDTELTGIPVTSEKLESIIEAVESSPQLNELDKLGEEISKDLDVENNYNKKAVVEIQENEPKTENVGSSESTEESSDDFVVDRRYVEATAEDLEAIADDIEITVEGYKDQYGNYYIDITDKGETPMYNYVKPNGDIIEGKAINEEELLRLVSIGALVKEDVTF